MRGLFDLDGLNRGPLVYDIARAVHLLGREARGSLRLRPEVACLFVEEYARCREPTSEERAALPMMGAMALQGLGNKLPVGLKAWVWQEFDGVIEGVQGFGVASQVENSACPSRKRQMGCCGSLASCCVAHWRAASACQRSSKTSPGASGWSSGSSVWRVAATPIGHSRQTHSTRVTRCRTACCSMGMDMPIIWPRWATRTLTV